VRCILDFRVHGESLVLKFEVNGIFCVCSTLEFGSGGKNLESEVIECFQRTAMRNPYQNSMYLFKHAQGSTTRVIQSTIGSSLSLPIHFTDSVY
jgi:hypothetical protein